MVIDGGGLEFNFVFIPRYEMSLDHLASEQQVDSIVYSK